MICPKCHTALPESAAGFRFCGYCGSPLPKEQPAPQAAEETPARSFFAPGDLSGAPIPAAQEPPKAQRRESPMMLTQSAPTRTQLHWAPQSAPDVSSAPMPRRMPVPQSIPAVQRAPMPQRPAAVYAAPEAEKAEGGAPIPVLVLLVVLILLLSALAAVMLRQMLLG